jgi:hypothetical protein
MFSSSPIPEACAFRQFEIIDGEAEGVKLKLNSSASAEPFQFNYSYAIDWKLVMLRPQIKRFSNRFELFSRFPLNMHEQGTTAWARGGAKSLKFNFSP